VTWDAHTMEKNWLDRHWVMLLVLGIVAIVFAIMAIVWPGITATAFTVLWGCWALVAGVVYLVGAFSKDATGRGWLILFGAVSIIARGSLMIPFGTPWSQ